MLGQLARRTVLLGGSSLLASIGLPPSLPFAAPATERQRLEKRLKYLQGRLKKAGSSSARRSWRRKIAAVESDLQKLSGSTRSQSSSNTANSTTLSRAESAQIAKLKKRINYLEGKLEKERPASERARLQKRIGVTT